MRKNKKWLEAVGSIEFCVLCKDEQNTQVAHNWENKGMGIKAPDYETAKICPGCHFEIDNGRDLSKLERHKLLSQAIVRTHSILIERGVLKLERT